ncbi:hypothetical protein PC110_g9540 [Phytophthora cactorum]|uniref:RxLR effector protein n=1 Tax=Phytophthora cactorum TaxID=29920 RepID=A0A329SER0_9STRA|nr:hypothetical protein PC110_g9540 [Phytophthora cactorum]
MPLLSIALALILQGASYPALVSNLPDQAGFTSGTLSPDVPLIELLNAQQVATGLAAPAAPPRVDTTPTAYTHAKQVLNRVTPAAGR